jgi:hypothetical protein
MWKAVTFKRYLHALLNTCRDDIHHRAPNTALTYVCVSHTCRLGRYALINKLNFPINHESNFSKSYKLQYNLCVYSNFRHKLRKKILLLISLLNFTNATHATTTSKLVTDRTSGFYRVNSSGFVPGTYSRPYLGAF